MVTITVTAMDSGGTANDGIHTSTRTFAITVNAVNDAPEFNAIGNQTANEDSGAHDVSITGVAPGGGTDEAGQTVTLTALSKIGRASCRPDSSATGATRTLN